MKRTYRVMTDFPEPTDAEAARWQNFDQLLSDYRTVRRQRQRRWRTGLFVLSGLLIFGWGIRTYRTASVPDTPPPRVASQPLASSAPNAPAVLRPVVPVPSAPSGATVKKLRPAMVRSADEEKFTEATPAGGYPALYDYFAQQLRYPAAARQAKVSGTVLTEFTIDTLGRPAAIRVIRGVRDDLDQEATRLIRQMPHWTPASVGKKPLATKHTMPLHFQLTHP